MQSKDDQIQVIGNLKNISMASSKLLLAAKSLSVDPGAANAKNLLAVAARCENAQKTSISSLCCWGFFCIHFAVDRNPLWNWSRIAFRFLLINQFYF